MNFFDWDAARHALLALIADKKSRRAIAEQLGTTPGSVASHLYRNPDLKVRPSEQKKRPKESKPKPLMAPDDPSPDR